MAKSRTPAKFKAVAPVLDVFRIVAPEFKVVEDNTVLQWLDLTAPMVGRKQFGPLYEQAVSLLAAHRMKIAGCGEEETAGDGGLQLGISDTLRVSSYSEGETSVSFNSSAATTQADSELTLTSYGMQYLSIRRMVIIPIRCSGEAHK
nr:DUF4054 domain-containing protein [uncultured Oscillibacter sp.]